MKRIFLGSLLLLVLVVVGMTTIVVGREVKKSLSVQEQVSFNKKTTKSNPENISEEVTLAEEKIGPGVIEVLQTEGEVNVVIALVKPPSMQASQVDLSTLNQEIANLQDNVLFVLDSEDFSLRQKYKTIPALAGKVLTEKGLATLATNPNVVMINLDVGGAGSLQDHIK